MRYESSMAASLLLTFLFVFQQLWISWLIELKLSWRRPLRCISRVLFWNHLKDYCLPTFDLKQQYRHSGLELNAIITILFISKLLSFCGCIDSPHGPQENHGINGYTWNSKTLIFWTLTELFYSFMNMLSTFKQQACYSSWKHLQCYLCFSDLDTWEK